MNKGEYIGSKETAVRVGRNSCQCSEGEVIFNFEDRR